MTHATTHERAEMDDDTESAQEWPRHKCPECGRNTVVEVVWGYPDPRAMQAETEGKLVLAGCLPCREDWKCTQCGASFTDAELEARL